MKEKKSDERGMMVVETVISFTAFIMVCLTIVFLINIFMLHNRVQFAINSVAHEIASYSYFYDVTGLRAASQKLDEDGTAYTEPIDSTVTQVVDTLNKMQNSFQSMQGAGEAMQDVELSVESFNNVKTKLEAVSQDINATIDSGKQSIADLTELFSDGDALLAGIVYMGISGAKHELKQLIAMGAAGGLCRKYLKSGDRTADQYLRSYGVINGYDGLDFSGSSFCCDSEERLIDIVVEYDVDLSFVSFVLPFAKIHVVQRVTVAGWCGGDGVQVVV